LGTGPINQLLVKYPIRIPLIGIAVAIAVSIAAYFLGSWELAIPALLLMVIPLMLLGLGLLRKKMGSRWATPQADEDSQ
jgi:hypothetical protein